MMSFLLIIKIITLTLSLNQNMCTISPLHILSKEREGFEIDRYEYT